ncbi:hypothetical protein T492DRAFT_1104473 [Pavlovales sp. CCMP2436]|nr:hypothetical protein T492DRAFT_1104473 [Pavlovales sp. CCMP2436]
MNALALACLCAAAALSQKLNQHRLLELMTERFSSAQLSLPVTLAPQSWQAGRSPPERAASLRSSRGGGLDLAFRGEFGYEMVALGAVFYEALVGGRTRVTGCGSMAPFYDFYVDEYNENSSCTRVGAVNLRAALRPPRPRALEKWADILLNPLPLAWLSPPLREFHRSAAVISRWPLALEVARQRRAVVVISNKFTPEFIVRGAGGDALEAIRMRPTNFFPISSVTRMIDEVVASGAFCIYNRPGNLVPQDAAATGQVSLAFADKATIVARASNRSDAWFGKVKLVEWYVDAGAPSYNDALVRVLALSQCTVSTQGGSWCPPCISTLLPPHM